MNKSIILFALCIAVSSAQSIDKQFINQKIHDSLSPISRLTSKSSSLKELDPHVVECLEGFLSNAIEYLAEDIFEGLACIEHRIDDIHEHLADLGEAVNKTLENAVPELEDHINSIVEFILTEDIPGAVGAVRKLLGFVIITAGDVISDVNTFVNEVIEIIKEEEAETCLLEAFVAGVTHLNEAIENLDTCINTE